MSDRLVLVIDNDPEAVKIISDTVQPMGYSVTSAATGDEGLKLAKTQSPLLILINLAVPGTDGLKICKSFISIIDAPLILLTMREGKYDPRYKSQYGIVDFLKKPINTHELIDKVNEFAPLEEVGETETTVESYDVESIELSDEEAPSAAELAASVASYSEAEEPIAVEEEPEAIEVLSDDELAEAVEVVEAIPEEEIVEAYEMDEAAEAVETGAEEEEWAVPEEAPAWEMSETDEVSREEAAPEWSMPEEEAPAFEEVPHTEHEASPIEEMTSTFEEATEEVDWEAPEEEPFEEEAMSDTASTGAEPFEEEQFAMDEEEPYELPAESKEYEVRPAALERAKRRKSKSRLLLPILALVLVGAIAGGVYFFFIANKGTGIRPEPRKTAPTVTKKEETLPPAAVRKPQPAPTTKPAPAPSPAHQRPSPTAKKIPSTKVSDGKTYYVQFGAFRSKANAVKFQTMLKQTGYDTFIKERTVNDEPLYLVLLSNSFTDKWTAFKQARQIKETSDIGTAVHME